MGNLFVDQSLPVFSGVYGRRVPDKLNRWRFLKVSNMSLQRTVGRLRSLRTRVRMDLKV